MGLFILRQFGAAFALILGLFVVAMGYYTHALFEKRVVGTARLQAKQSALMLADRVSQHLEYLARRAKTLMRVHRQKFKHAGDHQRFLTKLLKKERSLLAVTLYSRSGRAWRPVIEIKRPKGDAARINQMARQKLDQQYPLNFREVKKGLVDVVAAKMNQGTPILRVALPWSRSILTLDISITELENIFPRETEFYTYVVDHLGRLVMQSDPNHFKFGEDLSHLPIVRVAKDFDGREGLINFSELPGRGLQYGYYRHMKHGRLIIVSQVPKSRVAGLMRLHLRTVLFLGGIFLLIGLGLSLLSLYYIIEEARDKKAKKKKKSKKKIDQEIAA